MNRYKNHLIAAGVLSVLAIIGTIMNSHQSVLQAAGGPTVTIDPDQLPLPVHVNNTVTDPVRVRNVNDAIQPFQANASCNANGAVQCQVDIFAVPAGKRAVVEYFSGSAQNLNAGQVVDGSLITASSGKRIGIPLTSPAVAFPGSVGAVTSWGLQVRAYADSGTTIIGLAEPSAAPATPFVISFAISGYLVDVPLAP